MTNLADELGRVLGTDKIAMQSAASQHLLRGLTKLLIDKDLLSVDEIVDMARDRELEMHDYLDDQLTDPEISAEPNAKAYFQDAKGIFSTSIERFIRDIEE